MALNPARKGFDLDLADGLFSENQLRDILATHGRYIECKRDFKCADTGNVAIEYETSAYVNGRGDKHPSGISVTDSAWWAIEYAENCWLLIATDVVKALARRAFAEGRVRWGGDDQRFHLILIPFDWFREPLAEREEAAA